MESTVRISLDAAQTEPGELIVRAKKFNEITKKIITEDLIFTAEKIDDDPANNGYHVELKGDSNTAAQYEMTASDRAHFPELNNIPDNKLSTIPSAVLTEMINKTFYSISQEDNRYIYNGLYFLADGNKLTLVGTDGRRLSAISRELPSPVDITSDENSDVVVHAKAINELLRLLDAADEVKAGVEQRDIFFKVGDSELSSRLLEGKFPDYKKVIPQTTQIIIDIERQTVYNALQQVMVMTEPPSNQVKLTLSNSSMSFTSSTPDVGQAAIEIPVDYNGDELEIGFNAAYIIDIIRNLDCEIIQMGFENSAKPIVIYDPGDADFLSLVMPMKL